MKTINNLCPRLFASLSIFSLFLLASLKSYSQSCNNSLNTIICSAQVAANFNLSNGSFSSSDFIWTLGTEKWTAMAQSMGTTYDYVITSPSYYKNASPANLLQGGFLLSVGNKMTTNSVTLEIIKSSANTAIPTSCTKTLSITNASATICMSIFDPEITAGLLFKYRFTISVTSDANGTAPSNNHETTFDNFSFGDLNSNAPLPVDFSYFNAKRSGNIVSLNWETANEINSKGFMIQRKSANSNDFENFAFVTSKSSNDNFADRNSYSFTDVNNSTSSSFYRILQVDLDGLGKYTETRVVEGAKNRSQILVYPNPSSNGKVNISFAAPESKHIQLTDFNGRLLKNWNAYRNQWLRVENLKPGIYFIKISNATTNTTETQRIIIAR